VEPGIHPAVLPDADLFRELGHLYETQAGNAAARGRSGRCLHTQDGCAHWSVSTCAGARNGRSMSGGYRTGAGMGILAGSGR
jgi:hypothetical protein